ncbi:zinc-alpha-2-glycoprotein-like [Gracilinanus agilis]|uniref:zinc-alpha-2-glycoprotein-like n=1 Tax=Gracilinanus agilis TaxID=191870 RepID=UPI001CFEACE5|nr:zinc-alpha-2-glycoprotein-like [Gracilinanus agilis]
MASKGPVHGGEFLDGPTVQRPECRSCPLPPRPAPPDLSGFGFSHLEREPLQPLWSSVYGLCAKTGLREAPALEGLPRRTTADSPLDPPLLCSRLLSAAFPDCSLHRAPPASAFPSGNVPSRGFLALSGALLVPHQGRREQRLRAGASHANLPKHIPTKPWKKESRAISMLQRFSPFNHRLMGQLTVVGTAHSLLEVSAISFLDDVEVASYNKEHKQIVVKIPWISKALGDNYLTQMVDELLLNQEEDLRWTIEILAREDTNRNRNHTAQLLAECEIDNNITVKSQIHLIWDGVEYYRIDEEVGHWENIIPEFKQYQHILDSPLWTTLRKRYMKLYCIDLMRKVVGYSHIRDNVAPEVAVSQHVSPEGSIILSCIATGFYPRSILMHWEKNGKLGIWGNESSSGTLPNMDSTFYLKVTLELPPEDSGGGYSCVVEHSELKTPAMYSVPGKPTVEKSWVLKLGIVLAIILLLGCAGAFIIWKKRKTGMYIRRES